MGPVFCALQYHASYPRDKRLVQWRLSEAEDTLRCPEAAATYKQRHGVDRLQELSQKQVFVREFILAERGEVRKTNTKTSGLQRVLRILPRRFSPGCGRSA